MQKTAYCSRSDLAAPGSLVHIQSNHRFLMTEILQQKRRSVAFWFSNQTLRIMRMTTLLMLISFLTVSAASTSQTVTLTGKNLSIRQVFSAIEKQTGFLVWGKSEFIDNAKNVTVSVHDMPLDSFLNKVIKDQPFTFRIAGNTIILSERILVMQNTGISAQITISDQPAIRLAGMVLNIENNEKIVSATIALKGGKIATLTDNQGNFIFDNVPADAMLQISSVGFSAIDVSVSALIRMRPEQTIIIKGGSIRKIPNGIFIFALAPARAVLNEVVINNGMFTRNKESFTGAASVYTGAELRAVGTKNALQSLKTLDPSFIILENNIAGSNPNRLPTIEIRGRTTLTNTNLNDQFSADPNQPLFILDGFETTLLTIVNLDMNRIATITVLKDAASTALYGSKAANGVIVVETKRPVPGKLQISYSGDFNADLPDLSSYNLMNAAEKLQWERLVANNRSSDTKAWEIEARNAARLADVQRGVNTYWLHEPVQTGFGNQHSLQFNGGNSDLVFNAGAQYSKKNGVMKGSGKETWGSNITLSYRKGRLNVTNMTTLSGNKGVESPYGSFSTFAEANPYYRKTDANGFINKKLDPIYDTSVINPLYNASLFSINENRGFTFTNNIRGIFTITNTLRVEGGLQLGKGNSSSVLFIPPDNTAFDGVEANKKGSYTSNKMENSNMNANLGLAYGEAFGKHRVSANLRGQIENNKSEAIGLTAVGFPYGTNGNPAYSYGYAPFSRPSSSKIKSRGVGMTASVNYTWDNKYSLDAVYTLSGASAFGSNKRFQPFASVGLGWQINRESFMQQQGWINLLKLRANIGYSGNQNLGNFTSVSTYSYASTNSNYFGQGLSLLSLGSPDLEWSKTLQGSYGVDFSFLNGRISGNVDYFTKLTDPLSVPAEGTLPSSTALNNSYVINVGTLTTKGWNFTFKYSPIFNMAERIIWTVSATGSIIKSEYDGFSNRLDALNKEEQESQGLSRYYDGYSPDDIWAVRSLGIDPANGLELFQKKNGTVSYVYDPADIVRVGNTRPKIEGVIGTSFGYKDFTLGVSARYRIGGYVFNSAIYNKVENVNGNVGGFGLVIIRPNLDKRALYDRWQKPGDESEFTAIGGFNTTPMSNRFVQKDSHLIGESINLGWRTSAGWIRRMHLQNMMVNFTLNDIFRFETVQTERGLEYPFARTASLSVSLSF